MTVEAYQPKCNYINTAFNTANVNLDLSNAKVLEIFGNAGHLLADPENVVKEENYTIFETSTEAIEEGIDNYPNVDFRYWNHHNQMNHPSGNIDEPMPWSGDEKFDFIFPSLDRFETIPNDCMLCEAQSTLKDRFRLTQGKANTVPTNRYLFNVSK